MDTNYSEVKNTDFTTSRQVNSTDPMKIILMVYEGAIKFLKKAVEYGEQGDIRNKNIYTNKAADIIVELNNSLNMKPVEKLQKI
jgi:flagellar protein FliS